MKTKVDDFRWIYKGKTILLRPDTFRFFYCPQGVDIQPYLAKGFLNRIPDWIDLPNENPYSEENYERTLKTVYRAVGIFNADDYALVFDHSNVNQEIKNKLENDYDKQQAAIDLKLELLKQEKRLKDAGFIEKVTPPVKIKKRKRKVKAKVATK